MCVEEKAVPRALLGLLAPKNVANINKETTIISVNYYRKLMLNNMTTKEGELACFED